MRVIKESFRSRLKRAWLRVRLLFRRNKYDPDIVERGIQYAHYIDLNGGTHVVKKEQK